MDLIFTKDYFQTGSNRFGVLEVNDDLAFIGSFFMDDGGSGIVHLLEMSEQLLHEIQEKILSGEAVCQYREHFGVIINGDKTEIDSLLTDEIVATIPTSIFLEKLNECIQFIKSNYANEIASIDLTGCSK